MFFSVYIPLYNTEKYIAEAINSVLGQTYNDFELVIINDGSSDKSLNIAQAFTERDSRIRIISQENRGLFQARITAFRNVQGEYVIALDADDRLASNALEKIADALKKSPSVDMCEYCLERTDFAGKRFPVYKSPRELLTEDDMSTFYHETLFTNNHNSQCTKAIRRQIIQDVSEIENLPRISMAEDFIHTLNYLPRIRSIRVIGDVLYQYRYSADGMCNKFNINIIDDMCQVTQAEKRFLEKCPLSLPEDFLEAGLARMIAKALVYSPAAVIGREGKAAYLSVVEKTINQTALMKTISNVRVKFVYRLPLHLLKRRRKYSLYLLKKFFWRIRKCKDRINPNGK